MTPEEKLAALFAAEAPPARDLAFEARVAQRVAARRAWTRGLAATPLAVAAAAALWGLGQAAPGVFEAVRPEVLTGWLTAAGAGAAGLVWLSRRFSAA